MATGHDLTTITSDPFIRAYVECAFWSSHVDSEYASREDMPEDTSLESAGFGIEDLSPDAIASIVSDCCDFMESNADDLAELDAERSGHDFWLTRNRHGAGFWDRGYGDVGSRLTDASHPYGECDLYIGDDERIHTQ